MVIRVIFIGLFITVFLRCVHAQSKNAVAPIIRKNAVFVEVLGAGGYGSLNYEHAYFSYKKLRLNLRIGISTYVLNDFLHRFNPDIIVPFSTGITYGELHCIEAGIGKTFSSLNEINLESFRPERSNKFSTSLLFGYRWQPFEGNMMIRLAYIPIVQFNTTLRHWAGVSLGYKF